MKPLVAFGWFGAPLVVVSRLDAFDADGNAPGFYVSCAQGEPEGPFETLSDALKASAEA